MVVLMKASYHQMICHQCIIPATRPWRYAHDVSEPVKQSVARALLEGLWANRTGTLSTQILQEFYVVATRKFAPSMSSAQAREIMGLYGTWPHVQVDLSLILAATELEERHPLSFWDALVVEAARHAGATQLVTEDLQAGSMIAGVRIENPFA
jgi:predicted nucleic acid-binding protein